MKCAHRRATTYAATIPRCRERRGPHPAGRGFRPGERARESASPLRMIGAFVRKCSTNTFRHASQASPAGAVPGSGSPRSLSLLRGSSRSRRAAAHRWDSRTTSATPAAGLRWYLRIAEHEGCRAGNGGVMLGLVGSCSPGTTCWPGLLLSLAELVSFVLLHGPSKTGSGRTVRGAVPRCFPITCSAGCLRRASPSSRSRWRRSCSPSAGASFPPPSPWGRAADAGPSASRRCCCSSCPRGRRSVAGRSRRCSSRPRCSRSSSAPAHQRLDRAHPVGVCALSHNLWQRHVAGRARSAGSGTGCGWRYVDPSSSRELLDPTGTSRARSRCTRPQLAGARDLRLARVVAWRRLGAPYGCTRPQASRSLAPSLSRCSVPLRARVPLLALALVGEQPRRTAPILG